MLEMVPRGFPCIGNEKPGPMKVPTVLPCSCCMNALFDGGFVRSFALSNLMGGLAV